MPENATNFQTVLSPIWYGDAESAPEIVWRNLPHKIIEKFAKKLKRARFRFDHFHQVLQQELEEKGIICPHQKNAYKERLFREFNRRKRKWPEMNKDASIGGRPGIGDAAYLRAKMLSPFYEVEDNSAALYRELGRNGNFFVQCGFYNHERPGLRVLQYYEQVMIWSGLWHQWKNEMLKLTYEEGLWTGEELAVDPTHAEDYANVHKTSAESKTCGCERCKTDPVYTCEETDVVSKSKNFKMPGVKVGIVTDANSELPLVAESFNARIFDGKMGADLLAKYKEVCPAVSPVSVSLDSAFDAAEEKEKMQRIFPDATFFIDPNSRRRKAIPYDDPFIIELSPKGVPLCKQGEMEFYTRNHSQGRYVFTCPLFNPKTETNSCPDAKECCGGTHETRYKTVKRDDVPYVDWENPHFTKHFEKHYNKRTATERVNARAKWCLPFDRVWSRGKKKIQAHWDKMIASFHLFAHAMNLEGLTDNIRCLLRPTGGT